MVNAQDVLVDQPSGGAIAPVSSVINGSVGTYASDDFTITDNYRIDTITAEGFGESGSDISTNFTGLDIYIYADAGGQPDSDPSSPGTGVLEIINLDPASPALSVVNNEFIIDITGANGGTEVQLTSGTYWVVIAPRVPTNSVRWSWRGNETGGNAMLFDNGNIGMLPWTPLTSLGLPTNALAFSVTGTLEALSVDEFALETVSLFPNPAKNTLNLEMPASISNFSTEIYSVLGQSVAQSTNKSQLDISSLNAGMYLLKISTNTGTITKRFIKD